MCDADEKLADTPWARQCLEAYVALAQRAIKNGTRLSVENHYNRAPSAERDELLSSRPWHLVHMVELIRQKLRNAGSTEEEAAMVGIIFDSGHAFCDGVVKKIHGIADWLQRIAPYLHLTHFHQVVMNPETSKSQNHRAIADIFGPGINYHGLLTALVECTPRTFPLLMEVRDRDEAVKSLQTLRAFFSTHHLADSICTKNGLKGTGEFTKRLMNKAVTN
jgi:sugar phosphate isomerase/epimerase